MKRMIMLLASVLSLTYSHSVQATDSPSVGDSAAQASAVKLAPLSKDDTPSYDAKAMKVLGDVVVALGGESVLRRHGSKTCHGKFDVAGMIEGPLTRYQAAPNHYLIRIDLPGMGRVEKGFNGSAGWDIVPHLGPDPTATSADRMADAAIDADYFAPLNYKTNNRSIRYLGLHQYDGKNCHEIRLTRRTGQVEVRYIDATTHLPVGRRSMATTMMGEVVATRKVKEFREFDGEKVATRYTQVIGDMQEQSFHITDVSFAPIDKATFATPESIATATED